MISYILRHIWLVVCSSNAKLRLEDEFVLPMRSWITDCDINFHVNTARYFVFMELGRFDLTFRSGLFKYCLKNKIKALVLGTKVTFRREIKPLAKFEVRTNIMGHDSRFIYFQQKIVSPEGFLHSLAYIRTALYGKNGFVNPEILKRDLNLNFSSKELPEDLKLWIAAEEISVAQMKLNLQ